MAIKEIKKYKIICDSCKIFKVKETDKELNKFDKVILDEFYSLYKFTEYQTDIVVFANELKGSEYLISKVESLIVCKDCYNLLIKGN